MPAQTQSAASQEEVKPQLSESDAETEILRLKQELEKKDERLRKLTGRSSGSVSSREVNANRGSSKIYDPASDTERGDHKKLAQTRDDALKKYRKTGGDKK